MLGDVGGVDQDLTKFVKLVISEYGQFFLLRLVRAHTCPQADFLSSVCSRHPLWFATVPVPSATTLVCHTMLTPSFYVM